MSRFHLFIAAFAACNLLIASGANGDNGWTFSLVSARSPNQEKGYPLTAVLWPIAPIPTCWNMQPQTFNQYAVQRDIVRQAVADTWEAASSIRFTGWDRCVGEVPNGGITIIVNEEGPATYGLGTRLKNLNPGIQLNFEFTQWSPGCQRTKADCIRKIAVHEFGQALGFAHEQNRPDTPPGACDHDQGAQGTNGDLLVGAWDLASVMNYCNPKWVGDGKLSATDIEMVRRFYGHSSTEDDANIFVFDENGRIITIIQ